jgi:hypothetical protein
MSWDKDAGVSGNLTAGPAHRRHSNASGIQEIITGKSSRVAGRRFTNILPEFCIQIIPDEFGGQFVESYRLRGLMCDD